MPSEYQKWLARNEQPEEKRELTPKEKRQNWWHYYKWYVVAAAFAILCVIGFAISTVQSRQRAPDIQIGYIGTKALPADAVAALELALADFGQDITGDGTVKVYIKQYVLDEDVIALTQLATDLVAGDSRFYLLEDPKTFQDTYGALAYVDGVFGEEEARDEPLWYLWSECPVLAGLDLPNGQKQFSSLYIGRRGIDTSYEYGDMDNRVWNAILAGIHEK